ncbi:MAG: protoheme IX farnesyltransferase [Lentisphaeria bacterium]|nr:heme o synthase [Lentisphaeria bacterium]NQZ66727.1 protoheme IX farnesyltransferase [Lentisphaeria bacterium]
MSKIKHYIKLTKPSIMLLVIVTGAAGLVVDGKLLDKPIDFFLVLISLFLTGGSANALNQYLERDIDAKMTRTAKRRPLPSGEISPLSALIFSISIGVIGCVIFWLRFNPLSALLALGTILFYALFYTLYLKPNTPQNIVIGGIAGAMAPIIACAAAAGAVSISALLMFAIIFFWTPPHFWALALYLKDDYEKVDLPMMPKVKGEKHTITLMIIYTFIMVACSLLLYRFDAGLVYFIAASVLGFTFIVKSIGLRKDSSRNAEMKLFRFSIIYVLVLFMVIIVEGIYFHAQFNT